MTDLVLSLAAVALILSSPIPITGICCALVLCISVPARMKIAERQAAARLEKVRRR